MDRRTILVLLVMLVILFLFQTFFYRNRSRQPAAAPPAQTQTTQATKPATPAELKPALSKPAAETTKIDTVILENDKLKLAFTNRGGSLISARLKKFEGAELVPRGRAVLSSKLRIGDSLFDLSEHPFQLTRTGSDVSFSTVLSGSTLSDSKLADSVRLTKSYSLGDNNLLELKLSLVGRNNGYELAWAPGLGFTEKDSVEELSHYKIFSRLQGVVTGYGVRDLPKKLQHTGQFDWVGIRSKYFFAAIKQASAQPDSLDAWAVVDTIGPKRIEQRRRIGFTLVSRAKRSADRYEIIFAPSEYSLLRSLGNGYDRIVELGYFWIRPISSALLWFLKLLHKIFRNYGIVIIIFSFLMKAAFFPLTRRMTLQMKRMQQLQPKLEELKKRYKDDPKTLNQETMQLYRLHKVNPLGGCLPLLIQMPIFFALYAVLRSTIDLRQADFLWIRDLSMKDPYYILPILMGVFSLIQSLLTSTDKRQRLLQFGMPIFLTVIFLNFPSGLQLYWLSYNILSIIELVITKKGGK
jgi:YidC/Oxa1 family membrane protein insertase